MKPNIGIPEVHLKAVALELNKLLADEVILYVQTRNYHWNVEGSSFYEMHLFYEKQFTQIDEIMDAVAERIRVLGHYTEARLIDYLKLTSLLEPDYTNEKATQLQDLLNSHEAIIKIMRRLITSFAEEHKDIGSSDFVTQLLGKHETIAWMVRAYLK
jgi:starvation-inducible DNA-binding protein